MYISDETIEKFIKEDVPYLDLTSHILDIGGQNGRIRFVCREEAVVCGTEEAARIFRKLDVRPAGIVTSGTKVAPGTVILEGEGSSENLHMVWKAAMNILEHASGIATRTDRLMQRIRSSNPRVQLVTTRKGFPGTKELSIKAVVSGGGLPHRLGLSESVLVFKEHMLFLGGVDGLIERMDSIKAKSCENRVFVEVESVADAERLCRAGADGIQFDKLGCSELQTAVKLLRGIKPDVVILAAGGINEGNAAEYAMTGIDAIVTSSVYFGKPVDIGTVMEKI
jgi:molybdenum transport protein